MKKWLFYFAVCLGAFAQEKNWFIDYELDAYYSNAGLYVGLDDAAIPDAGEKPEGEIYRDLMREWYRPKVLVFEVGVNPMPIAGVMIKKHARSFYDEAQINEELNLVRSITAGFNDPYAVSMFLGNVVTFREAGSYESKNKGYMGFLVSAGRYHIRNNELLDDDWVEVEWKIKGDREFSTHELSWSFRVGGRFHEHPALTDTLFLSLRRGKTDFTGGNGWLDNSAAEYTVDFSQETLEPLRHFLIVEKRFPRRESKTVFALGAGFVWDSYRLYKDVQDTGEERDNFQFVFRPNLLF